jgi:glycosyltransferase involved in cell wall biosynthesis
VVNYRVYVPGRPGTRGISDDAQQEIIQAIADFSSPAQTLKDADIVHAPCWESLRSLQAGPRPVICNVTEEPRQLLASKRFRKAARRVSLWLARSRQDYVQMHDAKLPVELVPMAVNLTVFRPVAKEERISFRKTLAIPSKAYVIGNFTADTLKDLKSPCPWRTPHTFVAIAKQARDDGLPIHVLLAGPRRQWVLQELRAAAIPVTYFGTELAGARDDLQLNQLPRATANLLYNNLDVFICGSSSTSGPRELFEAVAANTRVISSRVGAAPELLSASALFDTAQGAVELLRRDVDRGELSWTLKENMTRLQEGHTLATLARRLRAVYAAALAR